MKYTGIISLALIAALGMGAQAQTLPGDTDTGASGMTMNADMPSRYQISLWGGYTMADLSDSNNALTAAAGGGSVTKINNGYDVAGDFLYEFYPRLLGGVRLEYLGFNEGKASATGREIKQDLYLIPVLAGVRYYFNDRLAPWSLSGGLFAGVGLGYGKTSAAGTTVNYDGSGFMAEVLVGGEHALSKTVSIGIDVGYRFADIPQMNIASSGTGGGGGGGGGGYAPRKSPVTNASGSTVKYDFSGVVANIGIIFKW